MAFEGGPAACYVLMKIGMHFIVFNIIVFMVSLRPTNQPKWFVALPLLPKALSCV